MSYHRLMMENHGIFTKKVFEELSERELSMGQPKILEYLSTEDGSVQKEIAKACRIEPATVTSLLTRMEKQGLVERRMQNENRRSWYVFLTEEGRREAEYVNAAFQDVEKTVFGGFSTEEREQFEQYLKRVNENLKKEV